MFKKKQKKDKYLSIITNFGCHYSCPYCIVKNNNIDVPETTLEGLLYLEDAVKETGANIISISGGGDPLHNYKEHAPDYYYLLEKLCKKMNIPLEMHTSYTNQFFPYWIYKRVVFHLHSIDQIRKTELGPYYGYSPIVRVVFVVTEDFTPEKIMKIVSEVNKCPWISELSFRQMVDSNYQATTYCQEFLRKGHKKYWWYIEQNDYNTYFVNGKLYDKFSDIHKEV